MERRLNEARAGGRRLFVPYLTAGLPSPQRFVDLLSEMATCADAIEVGIPFSDPVMDGPVITAASTRALEAFSVLSRSEGIIPALESSHALARAKDLARELGPGHNVLVNLSGRGDKDVEIVARAMRL